MQPAHTSILRFILSSFFSYTLIKFDAKKAYTYPSIKKSHNFKTGANFKKSLTAFLRGASFMPILADRSKDD